MNRPHDKLSLPFPQSPELTLYIDRASGMISKMERVTQFGNLDYVYSDYVNKDGITRATKFLFFVDGEPNLVSRTHTATFNVEFSDGDFQLPDGFTEEGERIDASEMLVNKISDNIYHIGQAGGFSIFIQTDDGLVAAGGYPALQARFDRYKAESGNHQTFPAPQPR